MHGLITLEVPIDGHIHILIKSSVSKLVSNFCFVKQIFNMKNYGDHYFHEFIYFGWCFGNHVF